MAVSLSLVDVIPPGAMTRSAVTETSVRIDLYYQRNKRLPPNLRVLPLREGYDNRITDGFGRPLEYTVDADNRFTLKSGDHRNVPGVIEHFAV